MRIQPVARVQTSHWKVAYQPMMFNAPVRAIHLRPGAVDRRLLGKRDRATQQNKARGHEKPGATEWGTEAAEFVPLSSPPTALRATAATAPGAAIGADAAGAADEPRSPTRDQQHSLLRRRKLQAPGTG